MSTEGERLQRWVNEDPDLDAEGWPSLNEVQAVLDELKAVNSQIARIQELADHCDGDGQETYGTNVADEIRAALRGELGWKWSS